MFSLNLTRWLIGYVRFGVQGGSPERFYTACARSGAYLWDIASGRNAGACVAARRYRRLRPCARRAGCRLRVRERRGLPFLLRRTRGHGGLWAGGAAFLLVVYLLSLHVWCVRVTGNTSIPAAQVESALASAGLTRGVLRSAVDPQELAGRVMLRFPQIRWMSVNLRGSGAEIVVQEKTAKPQITELKGICNVKAAATGQVLSMKVFAGTPAVKKGDAVVEGQLLVSAVVVDQLGGSTLTHASAEVWAETQRSLPVRVDLRQRQAIPTGRTAVRRSLDIFGVRLPVTLCGKPRGSWMPARTAYDVSLFGTPLPLGMYEEVWTETSEHETLLTREQARALAAGEAAKRERELLGNGRILSAKTDEKWEKDALVENIHLVCEENIAKESEIFIK